MEAQLGRQKMYCNGTGGGPPMKDDKYTDDILDIVGERKKHLGIVSSNEGDTFAMVSGVHTNEAERDCTADTHDKENKTIILNLPMPTDNSECYQILTIADMPDEQFENSVPLACSTPQAVKKRHHPAPQADTGHRIQTADEPSCIPSTSTSEAPSTSTASISNATAKQPCNCKSQKKNKRAVTLSANEDLNDEYLHSCIENNKADTELISLKKEKLLLEIMLMKTKANQEKP